MLLVRYLSRSKKNVFDNLKPKVACSFCNDPVVSILGFAGHMVWVEVTQFFLYPKRPHMIIKWMCMIMFQGHLMVVEFVINADVSQSILLWILSYYPDTISKGKRHSSWRMTRKGPDLSSELVFCCPWSKTQLGVHICIRKPLGHLLFGLSKP